MLAAAAALWLIVRAGSAAGEDRRGILILKLVIWLGLAAALLAAKLFPLALMVLLAAGGISAIEIWRGRAIREADRLTPGAGAAAIPLAKPGAEEAAAILGVAVGASEADIRAAHKRLIGQLHPDKGGTDYLAARINQARDALLAEKDRVL